MFCILRIVNGKIAYFNGYHFRNDKMTEVWGGGRMTIYTSRQEAKDVLEQLEKIDYDRLSVESVTIGL